MSATWSSPRVGSANKKKRRPQVQDFLEHSPNSYLPRPESPYASTTMAGDRRGDYPPRGPRADYRDDRNMSPVRPRYRDRSRSRSRSPRRAGHYSRRFDDDDDRPNRRSSAPTAPSSKHRPAYSPSRPSIPEDTRGSSSTTGSPFPAKDRPQDLQRPTPKPIVPANPPIPTKDHAEVVKDLANVFKKLIDEAIETSSLRSQKNTAQRKLEKRNADFMKSKQVHEKFPATEEFQRKSKDQAEKEYKAIDDKFEKKNASLNSLAVEAAENIIPSVLGFLTAGGSSKEQQKLQERFDSLQRTCQQFKQQFEEQKKFIEDLQNAKKGLENKCSTLETKYQKVQSEWGLTKNRQTQFDQDVKPEVAAHSKGILNLKQELSAAKENITQLLATKSQIPDNLKQQLEKIDRLSTRVNDFPSIRLELDKIRRESTVATKDITEEVKKLGTRVDSLESAISGVEGRQGLNHYVVDLVEWQQNLISAGIPSTRELVALSDKVTRLERSTTKSPQPKTESPDMSSLHKRVTQVERLVDPLPKKIQSCEESTSSFFKASAAENLKDSINTQISEVDKRLRGLEDKFTSTTNFKERLEALEAKGNSISRVTGEVKALETRLVKVEQEPPIAQQPTTTSPTSVQGNATMPRDVSSRLDSLGQAVDTFREQLDQMKEGNNAIMNSIGDTIDGQVQRATEEIGRQITSIESKLLGLDNSSDPTSHESLSALPQKFEDFRQAHAETIRSQNDEIKNAKDTLVAVAAARAVDILRSTPDALPPPDLQQRLIGHVNTMVNQLNSSLTTTLATYQDEIYANANNVNSLETRVNNINTGAIAAYMADQVLERFPHLQTTEATMIGFRTTLQGVTSEIQGLSNSVRHLQRGSQEPATATDSKAFKDLRLEVDKLTTNVTAANSMTKKTKDTVAEMQGDLQWTKEAMATLQEDAKDTKERLAVLVEDAKTTKERVETQGQSIIANNNYATEQITKFDTDIEKVSSDIEKISSDIDTMKEAATEPAPRSATSQVSSTNTPNGSKAIKSALAMPARYGRQGSAASAVSDGSLPSTANGSNKGAKPKLPTPGNRQPSMSSDTGNKKRKIPNGTSPTTSLGPNGTASNNSSPRKKARRKGYLDGDDPEDDDYDLPQPGLMSSDDDELGDADSDIVITKVFKQGNRVS